MFDHWSLKKKLVTTFGAILLFAGALFTLAVFNVGKLRETINWNTHTYKVLAEGQAMLLNMVNIETGLRGSSPAATRTSSTRSRQGAPSSRTTSARPSR